jgi:hypothetical protein
MLKKQGGALTSNGKGLGELFRDCQKELIAK